MVGFDRLPQWLLTAILLFMPHTNALSEVLKPTAVAYQTDKHPGTRSDECGISMSISSYPSPEIAVVRYSLIKDRLSKKLFLGFAISVSDAVFKDGHPIRYIEIPISYAVFSTDKFSTEGRLLGGPMPDGSVWIWSPNDAVASEMTNAFTLGGSRLTFSRTGSSTKRSYDIAENTPPDVLNKYVACVSKMTTD